MKSQSTNRSLFAEVLLCFMRFFICLSVSLSIVYLFSGGSDAGKMMTSAPARSLTIFAVAFNLLYLLFAKRASTAYAEQDIINHRDPYSHYLRRVYLTQLLVIAGVYILMVVPLYFDASNELIAKYDTLLALVNLGSFAIINPIVSYFHIKRFVKEYRDSHIFD